MIGYIFSEKMSYLVCRIEIDNLDEMIETQQLQKLDILNYSFLLDSW